MKSTGTMQAMVLEQPESPLIMKTLPIPSPGERQVLVKVIACGVCRTDLHIIGKELPDPKLPLIPGHEIIGRVVKTGTKVTEAAIDDFVGIPWLANTCGTCKYCSTGRENLCENALFTGYTLDGGFAEYTVAFEQFCFPLNKRMAGPYSAPFLCAGLIGYRSYRMCGEKVTRLGIYGFGAAAHILTQVAVYQGKKVYAFTRKGDVETQDFALRLGAAWAGDSLQSPPEKLDAAILFAPSGDLVPKALGDVDKGGVVVCGGIHMSDIPSFPYRLLWEERLIRSVANLTRKDGTDFLKLLQEVPVTTEITSYPLSGTNEAIHDLRNGRIHGAAVIIMP